ncbi:MAG: hypothetical protein AAFY56_16655 [Pseudomonadota bacterium]
MPRNAPPRCGSDDCVAFIQSRMNLQMNLAEAFWDEIDLLGDPGVIQAFLAWRREPRISSIVDLAMCIASDDLDQLLFAAEDYYLNVVTQAPTQS